MQLKSIHVLYPATKIHFESSVSMTMNIENIIKRKWEFLIIKGEKLLDPVLLSLHNSIGLGNFLDWKNLFDCFCQRVHPVNFFRGQ